MYSKLVCGLAIASVGVAQGAHVLVRRDGDHGHASGYAAPAPAAPAQTYQAAAPEPSYAAPADSYAEPASAAGYEAPYSGYGALEDEAAPFDISTLIIPLLVIFGLSLLFPTITEVAVNRKRRHAVDGKKTHTYTNHGFRDYTH